MMRFSFHDNHSLMANAMHSSAFSAFMGSRISLWIMVYTGLVISGIEATLLGQPQVPCHFIFGDSLVDNGNNNNLKTLAKANYLPYGIDFPDGPTGRFNNGRNIADILGELLGFQNYTPPFATAEGQEIIEGVNYASAAAGIRDESGRHLVIVFIYTNKLPAGDCISLNRQLQNHQTTISRLATLIGSPTSVNKHLSKCLYIVVMGNNDYRNNYFKPEFYPTSNLYTPDQYAQVLIQQYSQQLTTLHKFGARKIAVFGLGPIGCTPAEMEKHGRNGIGCVDSINDAVQLFNGRLKSLVDDLNANLSAAKFTYINTFSIQSAVPAALGLRVLNQPCCKVSTSTGDCIPDEAPCPVRSLNVFWDNAHPSEIANLFTAERTYFSLLPSDAHPVDIRHLAMQ